MTEIGTCIGTRARRVVLAAACAALASAAAAAPQTITYFGPAVAIPEIGVNGTPTEVSLPVSGLSGAITGIDISITGNGSCTGPTGDANEGVTHAWVGDLRFTLVSPNGTQVVLFNRPNGGGSGRICQVAFDDSAAIPFATSNSANSPFRGYYKPDGSLSSLNGETPNGTWKLLVADYSPGDTGTLNRFSLHIETDVPATNASTPLVGIASPNGPADTNLSNQAFVGTARNDRDGVSVVQYRVTQEPDPALAAGTWINATDQSGAGTWTDWEFTAALATGDNWVDVRSVGPTGAISPIARRKVTSSAEFNPPPTISFAAPADPEGDRIVVLAEGTTSVLFEGTAADPNGFVQLMQYDLNETGYNNVEFFDGEAWAQSIPVVSGANNTVKFRAIDDLDTSSTEEQWRIIVGSGNIPPVVNADNRQIVAPAEVEAVTVMGSAFDPDGTVTTVQFRVAAEDEPETKLDFRGVNPWVTVEALLPEFQRWTFSSSDLERPAGEGLSAKTVFQVRAVDALGAFSNFEEVEVTLVDNLRVPEIKIQSPFVDPVELPSDVSTIAISGTTKAGDATTTTVRWRVTNALGQTTFTQVGTFTTGFATWSFNASVAEGGNFIEVVAFDSAGRTSVSTPDSTLTVFREDDNITAPTVSINFPVGNQTVNQNTAEIPFSGTADDADGSLVGVIWQSGPSLAELGAPQYARNDSGDWTAWSFDAPLGFFDNYVQVYALDDENTTSETEQRIITRTAAPFDLAITSPSEGFTALNRENTVPFAGRATIGAEGLSLVQFRVTTESSFDAAPRIQQTPWAPATNDSGDWTRWSFLAPVGVGGNLVEVMSLDSNDEEIAVVDRTVERRGPGVAKDLMVLADDPSDAVGGDAWGSQNTGSGSFGAPTRMGPTGFFHDPPNGWLSAGGDFNGDGLTDFVACTPFGALFTVNNTGNRTVAQSQIRGSGYTVNPAAGQTVLVGDFNGDNRADVAQVQADGRIQLGLNDGVGGIPAPTTVGDFNVVYDPEAGYWLEVGDVNGDGRDDIVQIRPMPSETEVVQANPAGGFFGKETWGFTSFPWNPNSQLAVHVGDFNGDGLADIAQVDDASTALVSLSTGSSFSPPQQWGGVLGFHDDPNRGEGWWVFGLDADGDGVDDLVQLNDIGEVWIAISTGRGEFLTAEKDASLGFHHKPFGPWQTVPGLLVP